MNDIGYSTRNAFQALVTGSLLIIIYIARLILSLIFKAIIWKKSLKTGKIVKIEKIISEGVYFEYIFKIIIEGIVEISIFSILNYQTRSLDSIGEILGIF